MYNDKNCITKEKPSINSYSTTKKRIDLLAISYTFAIFEQLKPLKL